MFDAKIATLINKFMVSVTPDHCDRSIFNAKPGVIVYICTEVDPTPQQVASVVKKHHETEDYIVHTFNGQKYDKRIYEADDAQFHIYRLSEVVE